MIDPLRFDKETITTYEIERPAYCTSCLSQRQTRNNPNIAVIFCQECANLLGDQKRYGALLCSTCNAEKHKAFHSRNHIRQIVVVGPGLRKRMLVRGDGVNFPLSLDHVTIKMSAKIYHNGKIVHREPSRFVNYVAGMSGKCLHVQVLGARNLGVADISFTSDPYVIYSFCGKPLGTTRIRPRTLNPRWDNETFIVPLDESMPPPRDLVHSQRDLIRLEVYDHDWFTANDFLGHVEMTRSKLAKLAVVAQEKPIRIPLTSKECHGIMSVQFGHNSKELYMRIYSAEDLDKSNETMFSNPYCKIFLGANNLVGSTSIVKRSINPVWNDRNEFRISLHDYFQIEALLDAQLRYYRASTGMSNSNLAGSANGLKGGRRRGGAAMFQPAAQSKSRVMFEEFNDLPEYLSMLRIEIYNKRWLREDNLLGKTMIHVEQMRLIIPELTSLKKQYDEDPARFLMKNHHSILTIGLVNAKEIAKPFPFFNSLFNASLGAIVTSSVGCLRGLFRRGKKDKNEEDGIGNQYNNSLPLVPFSQRLADSVNADTISGMRDRAEGRDAFSLLLPESDGPPIDDHDLQHSAIIRTSSASSRQSMILPPSPAALMDASSIQPSIRSRISGAKASPSQNSQLSNRSSRKSGKQSRDRDEGEEDLEEQEEKSSKEEEEVEEEENDADREEEEDGEDGRGEEVSGSSRSGRPRSALSSSASSQSNSNNNDSNTHSFSRSKSNASNGTILSKVKSFIVRGPTPEEEEDAKLQMTDVFRLMIMSNSTKLHLKDVRDDLGQEDLGFLIVRLLISNRGKVISGIDEAVQRMTIGETSMIRCRYDYAYGSYAVDRNIPPRANVLFKIKLIEINGQGRFSGVFLRVWQRMIRQWTLWRRTWNRYWYTDYYSAAKRQGRARKKKRQKDGERKKGRKGKRGESGTSLLSWLQWLLTCGCVLGLRRSGGYPRRQGRHSAHDDLSNSEPDYSSYSESQENSELDNSLDEEDRSGYDSNQDAEGEEGHNGKRNRYQLDEDAMLEEHERFLTAKKSAAMQTGLRRPVKVDKHMKKHLTPSVKAGAKLMWNTPKTKLFENNLNPSPAMKKTKPMTKGGKLRSSQMKLISVSEEIVEEEKEDHGGDQEETGLLLPRNNGEEEEGAEEEDHEDDNSSLSND